MILPPSKKIHREGENYIVINKWGKTTHLMKSQNLLDWKRPPGPSSPTFGNSQDHWLKSSL